MFQSWPCDNTAESVVFLNKFTPLAKNLNPTHSSRAESSLTFPWNIVFDPKIKHEATLFTFSFDPLQLSSPLLEPSQKNWLLHSEFLKKYNCRDAPMD